MLSHRSRLAFLKNQSFLVVKESKPAARAEVHACGDPVHSNKSTSTFNALKDLPTEAQPRLVLYFWNCLRWLRIAEALGTFYMTVIQFALGILFWHHIIIPIIPFLSSDFVCYKFPSPLDRPSTLSGFEFQGLDVEYQPILYALANSDLARDDYALSGAGGRIVDTLTEKPSLFTWTSQSGPKPYPPSVVLQPTVIPNQCWHVYKAEGFLGISFRQPIQISHVTIDHYIDSPDDSPRHVLVWGVLEGNINLARFNASISHGQEYGVSPPKQVLAALAKWPSKLSAVKLLQSEFSNLRQSPPIQTFAVDPQFHDLDFGVVVFDIRDNWGAPQTCVYRIRVHGRPAS